jgi:integrase
LIKHAKEPLRLMVKIAIATGLRKHNLFNLRWDQIVGGYIEVTVKRDKPMKIPIPDQLQDDLQLYYYEQMRDFSSIYLFPTSRGDEDSPRCDRATLGLKELSAKLELGPVTWHTLRHTFASIALKETKNLALVRDMLGHSSVVTTNRYLHILDDEKVQAVNQVYRAWNDPPTPHLVDKLI